MKTDTNIKHWAAKKDLYIYPCNSSNLNTYELQPQSLKKEIITLENIKHKLIKLSTFNGKNTERIFVIFHSYIKCRLYIY